ncbi:unnamed protein product [Calicophoron daubneyi]|uniref:Arrestin C-terminal-like domain-containing protein n=1 Tax=Calicophoron daubneyi TaxID=300641 RepID=A0AAV2TSU9_CALDB
MESRASGSDTDCVSETNDIKLSNFQYSLPQKRLMLKLGSKAHPFRIRLPPFAPTSVTIQSNEEDTEKRSVRQLVSLKLPAAFDNFGNKRERSQLKVYTESMVFFNKHLFYHEEPIDVEVSVDNLSCLSVRKVRVADMFCHPIQLSSILSPSPSTLNRDNLHISSGTCGWRHAFVLKPRLTERISRRGVAVDGLLKQETPRLASSTIMKIPDAGRNYHQPIRSVFGDIVVTKSTRIIKELQGIIVWYMVEARCSTRMNRVTVQLPFLLMHPPPDVCDNDHIKKFHQPEAPSIPGEFSHTPRQKRSVTLDEQNNVEI